MAQCWFCGKVKGKRICPARGGELICSRCCGSKRRVEIRCPSDCSYLRGAHDAKWTPKSHEKEEARFFSRLFALDEREAQFFTFLHYLLTRAKTPLPSLSDRELSEVVATASKTLETLARGVLYSHPAASPHLQSASEWLVRVVTQRREIQGAPELSDAEAQKALSALASAVEEHAREESRERYLEMIERMLSESTTEYPPLSLPAELEAPRTGLIVGF